MDQAADTSQVAYTLRLDAIQAAALRQAIALSAAVKSGDLGPVLAVYGSHTLSGDGIREARDYLVWAQGLLAGAPHGHTLPPPDDGLGRISGRLDAAPDGGGAELPLTRAEAGTAIAATETAFRLMIGQAHPILDEYRFILPIGQGAFDTAEAALARMHTLLTGMPVNGSHGIRSDKASDTARVLYDIHQVLRHQAARERELDSWHVWQRPPSRTSAASALPEIIVHAAPSAEAAAAPRM